MHPAASARFARSSSVWRLPTGIRALGNGPSKASTEQAWTGNSSFDSAQLRCELMRPLTHAHTSRITFTRFAVYLLLTQDFRNTGTQLRT